MVAVVAGTIHNPKHLKPYHRVLMKLRTTHRKSLRHHWSSVGTHGNPVVLLVLLYSGLCLAEFRDLRSRFVITLTLYSETH
jgi:hypothetical protein